jgi:hypothetical protein
MFSKDLLALKKDPDRVILSEDNGNCVVVMDVIIAIGPFHC